MNWIQFTDLGQIQEIISLSEETPCVIFKHSTRCSISSMALNRFERNWSFENNEVQPYFLDLIAYREISNTLAEQFDVKHESPQMLIIKNGQCVFDSSHQMIRVSDIQSELVA